MAAVAGRLVGDVAGEADVALAPERSRGLAGRAVLEVQDRDAGAVLGEEAGGAEPDAARTGGARNNSGFALEQHVILPGNFQQAFEQSAPSDKREICVDR